MPLPPGTIGIPTADSLARYHVFTLSMATLTIPPGSTVVWSDRMDMVDNLNRCVEQMSGEWLFLLDDDMAFTPDLLVQLLAHLFDPDRKDIDIMVPLVLSRHYPFTHVIYEGREEKGFTPVDLTLHEPDDVIEVTAAGSCGMVIHRRVLDAMGAAPFVYGPLFEGGPTVAWDLRFCEEARKLGFRIWCNLGATMGHIRSMILWPETLDNVPGAVIDFGGGHRIFVMPGEEENVEPIETDGLL